MPTNTQKNDSLTLTLGSTSVECQVMDLSFKLPSVGASTITEVACPGGRVAEPGSVTAGSLTGTVFTDTSDTGITKILQDAIQANATLAYVLTMWADLGPTKAVKYSGNLRVNTLQLDWNKPGLGKHPLDLEVSSATFSRPAAQAAA